MNTRSRILLLEPNRYRALLLHRAVESRIPEAICVRFSAPEPALEELGRGAYVAVVVNLDSLTVAQAGRLSVELQHRPSIPAILQTSPETSRRLLSAVADMVDYVLMTAAADPEVVAEQLALELRRSPNEPIEKPVEPHSQRLQMTLGFH